MKNPNPINLVTTEQVRARGWIAEARDDDGHLISTVAWSDTCTTNENLKNLGEFIESYETDKTVSVFHDLLSSRLSS